MKTVVALPGQGIGVECVDATCELLTAAGLPIKILTPPQGEGALKSHGRRYLTRPRRRRSRPTACCSARPARPPRRWFPGCGGR